MQFCLISSALPALLPLGGFSAMAVRRCRVSVWTGTPEKWPRADARGRDAQRSSLFKVQLFLALSVEDILLEKGVLVKCPVGGSRGAEPCLWCK